MVLVVCSVEGCKAPLGSHPVQAYQDAERAFQQGQLDLALQQVDQFLKSHSAQSAEWAWRFRILKGEILVWRGASQEAFSLLREELPASLKGTEIAVRQKLVLGMALDNLHRIPESQNALSEAEKLAEAGHSELLGEIAQARGNLDAHQEQFLQAKGYFQEALRLSRKLRQQFLETNALGSLGYVAMWQEHYDEAIDWFKGSLVLSEALNARASSAKTLGNIGWSYHEIGDLDNALPQFHKAEQASQDASLPVDQAYWLNSAAGVEYDQHNYSAAEADAQRAVSLAKQLKDDGTTIECLQTIALVQLQRGQKRDAAERLAEAEGLETPAPNHQRRLYTRLIAAEVLAGMGDFSQAERSYSELLRDPESRASLRWEAMAGLANVHASRGRIALAENEFNDAISTISKAWDALEHEEFRLSFLGTTIRFYDAYVDFLIAQHRPLDALRIADLSRAQTLEHGLSPADKRKSTTAGDIRPQEIARRWNATLLFYRLGEQGSHLWVITPAKVSLLPLPRRSEIDASGKSYLEAFPDPRDPLETGNADGKKLYETLIKPAEKLIPKNSRVIILPDGELNSLNFETLIVPGEKPHYWIEDVTLSTGNSLALLAKTSPTAPPKDANLFLMGDALQASPDFPPLPQAGKEVGLVQNYFAAGRRSVLTGAQAIPSRFLSGKPEEFSYLHFATHGTASTLRPLESAVILSPEGDAYKLYARDIVQHPVHAYLVTISACNGAGMKTYAGEGLVGLAWAFLRAGAHNVIGGLWEVSNASTPQLMDELYKGLNDGKDPATALRNAKLTLVHSPGNYHRPFYWGPFQLYAGS